MSGIFALFAKRHLIVAGVLLLLLVHTASRSQAAEPSIGPQDLPRIAPTEPERVLQTFRVKEGFVIELAAAEPLVVDPIAMSFDEDGRLYVVEMRDYSERRDERLGRIRLLEDTNDDGRFDKSSIFVEGLPWPTAVFCYEGGVFVGATPDILFCKDTNGDRAADVKEVVFTGFASDYAPYQTNRLNVQAMVNSFNWGLDHRIHGVTSMAGGKVKRVESRFVKNWLAQAGVSDVSSPALLDLRGKDFSFDPRTLDLRPESGGAQHGMSFDDRGRKFVCSNSSHIQLVRYEHRYTAQNVLASLPPPLADIAVDGPAAEVFRLSPDEPWRVIRTRWRVAGLVPGPIEGGGRASGYFTGATGVTIYRGDAFPEEFRGDAFTADCGSNLVHRKKLLPDDVFLKAQRPADEKRVEFLASTDNWFRPVQFANAPDGCLYVADMYREIIEHPWSLPQPIKQYLDLNSGNDRGRIYRIAPKNFKRRAPPALGRATTAELVQTLAHANAWHRDTAARLLHQRQDKSAVSLLEKLLQNSDSALGRLHALYALASLKSLPAASLRRALADPDPAVRQHALRLTETHFASDPIPREHWEELMRLVQDNDPLVRYQLAFSLGQIAHPNRIEALTRLALTDSEEGWIQRAALLSVGNDVAAFFKQLSRLADHTRVHQKLLRQTAELIGARNRPAEVAAVIEYLSEMTDRELRVASLWLAGSLGTGLERAGTTLARVDAQKRLEPLLRHAEALSTNAAAADFLGEPVQVAAIRLLSSLPFSESGRWLVQLLEPGQPEIAQQEAISALAKYTDAQASSGLIGQIDRLTPALRSQAVEVLLRRSDRVRQLVEAIQSGKISRAELTTAQLNLLRKNAPSELREQMSALLGPPPARRAEVLAAFSPALQMNGNRERGQKIFLERCATCHRDRPGGTGFVLGPDLVTVKSSGKETVVGHILDPNREVQPKFLSYNLQTKDGDELLGIISQETAGAVTLRGASGTETTVPRSKISRLQSQGQSLMPEGLEEGLTPQDMADLLEFIVSIP
ncbi:MAG: PVC-type heme-binding CxxCH protein [Verrucomicrobiota bacterium]